jgi:hypothetical protein
MGEEQYGLMDKRSGAGLIFLVREIIEKLWKFNKGKHFTFTNTEKSYGNT